MVQVLNQITGSGPDNEDFALMLQRNHCSPTVHIECLGVVWWGGGVVCRAGNVHHDTVVQTPKVHVTLSQNIRTFST